MFDSTPDLSHTDQMSEIIRYVHISDGKVEVKEVFLCFFPLKGKKAADLTSEILKVLGKDGLDIMMCRSQGYDNAATMAGIHGGVQALIKKTTRRHFSVVVLIIPSTFAVSIHLPKMCILLVSLESSMHCIPSLLHPHIVGKF